MSVLARVEADPEALRHARRELLAGYAAELGLALAPRTIRLEGGDAVQVDGAADDESIIVEVDGHDDPSAEGLRARIGQAVLTLSLVHRARPNASLVLLVANDEVRRSAVGWVTAFAQGRPVHVVAPAA